MTFSPVHSLRQSWQARAERPSFRLVRLFVDRIFHGGGESEEDDLDLSLGLILTVLALPGACYSIFLFDKYGSLLQWLRGPHALDPLAAPLPADSFFFALSLLVRGTVTRLSSDVS